MKVKDSRGMALTYYESAGFIEAHGKDASDVRSLGYRTLLTLQMKTLERIREFDQTIKLKVIATEDACAACKRQDRRTVSLREAQSERVLPVKSCDRKHGCRCVYAPQIGSDHRNEWTEALRL